MRPFPKLRAAVLMALVLASCNANRTTPTEPEPVGVEIRWVLFGAYPLRPPVMLVGDTLTFRPQLVDTDGSVIETGPHEWQADLDSAVLRLKAFRAQALAPTPPGRSTALFYKHQATGLAAAIEIVILPDTDP